MNVAGTLAATVDRLPWPDISDQLDTEGYAVLPALLTREQAVLLAGSVDSIALSRCESPPSPGMTGRGTLTGFGKHPPQLIAALRQCFYPHLAGIANHWNDILGVADRYPPNLDDYRRYCRYLGQTRPLSYVCRLVEDDYIGLHRQDADRAVFPLQIIMLLSDPGEDFRGGEFVMTEQRPRMQSRPMVVPLALGDVAVIATSERPFSGSRGHYRVTLKHAISRVRGGVRVGAELSFHDGR